MVAGRGCKVRVRRVSVHTWDAGALKGKTGENI